MIDNTITADKTIAASGKDAILAGRYRIIRQLGRGGTEATMCNVEYGISLEAS